MVKVRGKISNRNIVKQNVWKWPKISGDDDVAGMTSPVPGVKSSGLRSGLELDRAKCAGRIRSDSGWLWTFWIDYVTLHNCDAAPMTSQTLARVIFSLSVRPSCSSNFDPGPSPPDSAEKICQSIAYSIGVLFSLDSWTYMCAWSMEEWYLLDLGQWLVSTKEQQNP